MELNVKMDGLERLEKAVELAGTVENELRAAISDVRVAIAELRMEINQPPAEPAAD